MNTNSNKPAGIPRRNCFQFKLAAFFEPLSIAFLLWYLLDKTWMRWPDPLIDFPRYLYTAWRMSEGDLLYENISSWYGPLPHLVEALAFRIFGSGLDTIVWLNITVMVLVLLLIRRIFWELADRLTVWLVSVVFLSVFGVAQFVGIGNYNFVTPYASQATYGMAGCLLTAWALLRSLSTEKRRWLIVAGMGLGVAYENKPEPLLATGGMIVAYLLIFCLRIWNKQILNAGTHFSKKRALALTVIWLITGFSIVYGLTFGALAISGGISYGFTASNWVPYSVWNSLSGPSGQTFPIIITGAGMDSPLKNLGSALLYGLIFTSGVLIVHQAGQLWSRGQKKGLPDNEAIILALGLTAVASFSIAWTEIGRALLFSVAIATIAVIAACVKDVYREKTSVSKWAGPSIVGCGALLMLSRMLLNTRIYHYGFFMALLATLFLVYILIYLIPRWRSDQPNALTQIILSAFILSGVVGLNRQSSDIFNKKTLQVGQGRDRFYTFPPQVDPNGALLNEMLTNIPLKAPDARTVVAFPETAAINYFLRLKNPVTALEFHPWALSFLGRDKLLSNLTSSPPDVIAIYLRDLSEYGPIVIPGKTPEPYFFGKDVKSGLPILEWIAQNYTLEYAVGDKFPTATGHAVDILTKKNKMSR